MQSHINSFADPVNQASFYRCFCCMPVCMRASVRDREREAQMDTNSLHGYMKVSVVVIYVQHVCVCMLIFACAHFLHSCLGWCNAKACCVPTIPSFSFFAAPSKEAEPLCVCQPSSPGPIVKLNKPVCSGDALTYSGEHKSKDKEEGGRRNGESTEENSFGRELREGEDVQRREEDRGKGEEIERNFIVWRHKLEWLT